MELIGLLRQLGDLDGARNARNAMSKVFPLTEGVFVGILMCLMRVLAGFHVRNVVGMDPGRATTGQHSRSQHGTETAL